MTGYQIPWTIMLRNDRTETETAVHYPSTTNLERVRRDFAEMQLAKLPEGKRYVIARAD